MENAIQGSLTIPADERYIHLFMDTEDPGELYILLTNRFDGFHPERDGRFSSRKRVTASAFPQSGLPQKNITVWPALEYHEQEFFPPASC